MPFEVGRAKTGGRVKGVPPKKTVFTEHLEANDFDLIREVVALFRRLDDSDRIPLVCKMLDFAYAKKNVAEITVAEAQKVLEDDLAAQGFDVGTALNSTIECAEGEIISGD